MCSYFTYILFELFQSDFNHYPVNKKEYVLAYISNSLTKSSNKIKIDFPTSLAKNSVLIETESEENFLSCEYFVQIGAYGNKKYAYEAKDILNEIELITIDEIYSSSKPGKLLHSVITGPYENRSAANNIKEKITNRGFDPQLRTLCEKN